MGGQDRCNHEAAAKTISIGRTLRVGAYLIPYPIINPAVTKSPPMLCSVNPLNIWPAPMNNKPRIATFRAPIARVSLLLGIAKAALQAMAREPTKDSVDGDATFILIRAA